MKVILLKDVAKIGLRNEIVDVPNGYAANKLIPNKMAEPATPANLKRAQKVHTDKAGATADVEAAFAAAKTALAVEALTITAEMNDQDHTFQAVSADEVAAAAAAKKIVIAAEAIDFSEPVKSAGEHSVKLTMGAQSTDFTINVVKA